MQRKKNLLRDGTPEAWQNLLPVRHRREFNAADSVFFPDELAPPFENRPSLIKQRVAGSAFLHFIDSSERSIMSAMGSQDCAGLISPRFSSTQGEGLLASPDYSWAVVGISAVAYYGLTS